MGAVTLFSSGIRWLSGRGLRQQDGYDHHSALEEKEPIQRELKDPAPVVASRGRAADTFVAFTKVQTFPLGLSVASLLTTILWVLFGFG